MNSQTFKVEIHLYDLSQGMAKQMSPMFLGKQIDGIWHTGIVIYGIEYYFGGGICYGTPKFTPYGRPVKVYEHGETSKSKNEFKAFLSSIGHKYSTEKYDLLKNNCNNFTDDCSQFLLNKPIPSYITGLPAEVLNSPIGMMLKPMLEQMTNKAMSENTLEDVSPQKQQQLVQGEVITKVVLIENVEMFTILTSSSHLCIVDFYAEWSGPCLNIKPTYNTLSSGNVDINFYEVNIEKSAEILKLTGVSSVPSFITFKDGLEISRWTGGNIQALKDKVHNLKD